MKRRYFDKGAAGVRLGPVLGDIPKRRDVVIYFTGDLPVWVGSHYRP